MRSVQISFKVVVVALLFAMGGNQIHGQEKEYYPDPYASYNKFFSQSKLLLVDPLEPVFPDTNTLSNYSSKYHLDFPQGTVADVHIVLQLPVNESVKIKAFYQGKVVSQASWSQLIDVPVEQNTGIDSRTEQYLNKPNPYVIRKAPFRIYEAIAPLKTNSLVTKNPFTVLRLAIPTALLSQRGISKIQIVAQGKDWTAKGEFEAVVHPAKLPLLKDSRFFYTNWFRMSEIESRHQVIRWSNEWYTVLEKYLALMASERQNAIIVPEELLHMEKEKIVLEEEKMLRFITLFRKYGFKYFESPHLMDRGKNDDWANPELKVVLTGRGYSTPEAKQDIDTIVGLIKKFTTKYQLTHNWLQHISDEPTRTQAICYKEVVQQVKSIYSEIKIIEATNDREGIAGAVDIWCPLINDFQENESFFREREKMGEKILVYTCLIPGGPWLNRLLDQERLRQVYFGWGAAHYNTFGFLHWGLNQYYADPWNQSVVYHPAPGAGTNNFLPAGDTHIIYPGVDGPLSSTRLEAHRIGIEDYELLTDLKLKNKEVAHTLINKLFRNYTDYSTSIKEYREVKKQVLEVVAKK